MSKKTILFVDDEENIIDGLKRQLRPFREQWRMFFVSSGQAALELMDREAVDLIVTDMMMPEMKGDELLQTVQERYPGVVRIVLSGHADEATLKSGLASAHQYLGKPCGAETIREIISQIFRIQECVCNPRIIACVGDPQRLPCLPRVYLEINKAVSSENYTIEEIADIIGRDMVLSAKLLHLINSPYFGMNRIISNLTDAVKLIGVQKINSLVLSEHIKNAFPVNNPKLECFMEYLWLDAHRVADLALLISLAEDQPGDRPDQAYMGGLLHNIGLLIYLWHGGDKLDRLIDQVANTDIPVAELENAIFGFTRSEVAAYLLSLWNIPPRIIESILLRNRPMESDYDGMNALTAVHVASGLLKPSVMMECDRLFDMQIDDVYLQRINKLGRLPDWRYLADKVLARHAQ